MLKKALRIRKKEDFDRVFRFGRPFFFGFLVARVLLAAQDREAPSGLHLGFSFSPKHVPRAVDRNRLRRVLAAAVAELGGQWPKSAWLVFSSRQKVTLSPRLRKSDFTPFLEDLFLNIERHPHKR